MSEQSAPHSVKARCNWYVRLRGLPWGCTKQDVREFFDRRQIEDEDVHVLLMPDGKASGEALVGFGNQEDFDQSSTYDKKHLQTRYIEVYPSTAEEWERKSNSKHRKLSVPLSPNSFVILMRGLPFSASEDDCIAFFETVPCLGVHLTKDSQGRPSGQGYAEFETREQRALALQFHKKNLQNRYVELFESNIRDLVEAVDGSNYQNQSAQWGGQPAFLSGQVPHTSSYPWQRQAGNGNGYITSSVTNEPICIKMRGLPYNTTDVQITDFFSKEGVTPQRIHRKQNGAEAYVEFGAQEDADAAMRRNKAFMGKRYVELFQVDYSEVTQKVGLDRQATHDYRPRRGRGGSYGTRGSSYNQRFKPYPSQW